MYCVHVCSILSIISHKGEAWPDTYMDTRAKGCKGLFRSVCCVACTVYMCVAYSPLFPTKEKPDQIPIWTPGQRDVKACSGLCAVWHVLCTCVACIVYICLYMCLSAVWHVLRTCVAYSPCISHKGEVWPETYMDTRAMEVHTKWVGSEKCYFAQNTINGTLSMCDPTQQTPYIWGTHNMKGTRYQALWCEL